MKNSGLCISIIVVLTCLAIRPLFKPGFFTMHDDQQVVRLAQMDKALKAGQFPVRWVSDLGFGYGYPLFNFYPPLVYYLGEIYYILFQTSYIVAIKLVIATSFIGSALAMYWWTKKHLGQLAGCVAALFYVFAPYRAVDVYVRGALAESFSFVWLPIILLAMDLLADISATSDKTKKQSSFLAQRSRVIWILILGLSYASLMITHNLIVLPFTLIMALYYVLKIISQPTKNRLPFTVSLVIAGILGIGLSAFFWLPALTEMKYTLVDEILLVEGYEHSLHYVLPNQLWNSLWGYGGSSPDHLDGFSLKIGKLHLVLAAIVGIISGMAVVFPQLRYFRPLQEQKQKLWLLISSFFLLGYSAWMTTASSAFIWDNFPPIQFLQFPWRFLTFTTLFSSILAGATLWLLQQYFSNKWLVYLGAMLITGILFWPNLKLFQPQIYLDVQDEYYTSDEFTKWLISKTSFEFVPKGVETTTDNDLEITQLAIDQDQIAQMPYEVVHGQALVTPVFDYPDHKLFSVKVAQLSLIQFNTFNFPGWRLSLDGNPIDINDDNRLKLISSLVAEGEHLMELKLVNTPARQVANVLSLLSWILVICLLGYSQFRKRLKQFRSFTFSNLVKSK